jgi:hypothetical protein
MSRTSLQTKLGTYSSQGDVAFLSPPAANQLAIHTASVENRSGAAADAGILRLSSASRSVVAKLVDADTPDASDITDNYPQDFFEVNNDGFLVEATRPFGAVGVNVGTGAGAGGVYTFEYFDGTNYVAVPAGAILQSPDYTATGLQMFIFLPPNDWALGGEAPVGASGLKYSIRVRSTTAPATAMTANGIFLAEFLAFKSQLADDGVLSLDYPDDIPLLLEAEEGVMPYFGTANDSNVMTVVYGTQG